YAAAASLSVYTQSIQHDAWDPNGPQTSFPRTLHLGLARQRRLSGRRPVARLAVRQDSDLLVLVGSSLSWKWTLVAQPVHVERNEFVLGTPRLFVPAKQVLLQPLTNPLVPIHSDAVPIVLPNLPKPQPARVGQVEIRSF